ncbi:hypothetical protein [Paenibacillus hexagrammi]|uniref:Uncharacterized protein n=1 Tax=Paenibacillus hexagrammi TaxID=2908839 RepID=A0ABY3SQI3_9BACL|nr:hypothetical protein [Paenibacillus sp. YPD9-1]UJF35728.1 hypothetical protein L0M14_11915 [Paenibacillus sp. YPD9-1]
MKTNRTFFFYFLSYLLVIIVPVISIGVFSYQLAIHTVEDELSQANVLLVNQESASMNQVFRDIHSLSVAIGLDGKVYAYAKHAEDPYLLNDVKDLVKTWASSSNLVHSIQLYVKKSDGMISSNGLGGLTPAEEGAMTMQLLHQSGKKELWLPTQTRTDKDGNPVQIVTCPYEAALCLSG